MNPYKEYQSNSVNTADSLHLIVMLYEGALRFTDEAISAIENFRTYDKANASILRVQDILTELMLSLDMEKGGEISQNLFNLYAYMKKTLLDANIRKDKPALQEVRKLLADLAGAWKDIEKNGAKPAAPSAATRPPAKPYEGGFAAQG